MALEDKAKSLLKTLKVKPEAVGNVTGSPEDQAAGKRNKLKPKYVKVQKTWKITSKKSSTKEGFFKQVKVLVLV